MIEGARQVLESPYTMATVIRAVLQEQYGEDVYDWDPATVFLEIRDDLQIDIPDTVMNRWAAIQTAVVNDSFFSRIDGFLGICNTLATGRPAFDVFSPTSLEEIAWGVAEIGINRDVLEFAPAIKTYVRKLMIEDGYEGAPTLLAPVLGDSGPVDLLGVYHGPNESGLDAFVVDKMDDMLHQFDKIPSIDGMAVLGGGEGPAR